MSNKSSNLTEVTGKTVVPNGSTTRTVNNNTNKKIVPQGINVRPSRSTSSSAPKERTQQQQQQQQRAPRIPSESSSSPTNSEPAKKVQPSKAPVGIAKPPDLKNVSSKIGSLANVKHKPAGGEKKPMTQKLDWSNAAKSKIGSLENKDHKAGGGERKVLHQKLEWKVTSKIGSLDNVKHKAGGGQIQIFDEKYSPSSSSRSSSTVRPSSGTTIGSNITTGTSMIDSKAVPEIFLRGRTKENQKQQNSTPASLPSFSVTSKPPPLTELSKPGTTIRTTSATRRTESPSGSNSAVRKQVLQKTNDSNNGSTISAPHPASSSSAAQPVATNQNTVQNENPNSNPKPPIPSKPVSHNLKFWKKKENK